MTGKQTSIKNKVSIEQRPAVVDAKERFGDWEIDTITADNGAKFTNHEYIATKLNADRT